MSKQQRRKPQISHSKLLLTGTLKVSRIVIISFVLVVLGFLWVVIVFNGGIEGAISNLKSAPEPVGKKLTLKREAVIKAINTSFKEVENDLRFNMYGTSTHDVCYKGDNNWKRSDGYAYRCTYRITKIYGFNSDFRQQMIDFEQNLYNIGWESPYDSAPQMKKILEGYYDKYHGTGTMYYPKGYYVSNLPTPKYEKNEQILAIEYAERAIKDISKLEYSQDVTNVTYDKIFEEKKFQDISSNFEEITATNNFVLGISIQQDYFED